MPASTELRPLLPIRRFDVFAETKRLEAIAHGEPEDVAKGSKFVAFSGELQTDETFDREIIERMGPEFYDVVFAPTIREALDAGRKYEQIRDTIRKDWKPLRA